MRLFDLIAFYEAIPESEWCKKAIKSDGRRCAIGHLIRHHSSQWLPLLNAIEAYSGTCLALINDSEADTAKQNVLRFLRSLEANFIP